jgi:hypothetical protein
MALPLPVLRTIQNAPPKEAWTAIIDYAWEVCSQPLKVGNELSDVSSRDLRIADIDHYLSTSAWDLWTHFKGSTESTAKELIGWWSNRQAGKAVLVLDGFSLRELPWLLHQAESHGLAICSAKVTTTELPADTTPFAQALGFGQRSSLGNNGAPAGHRFPGARTETVDLPWKDCAELIHAEPDWFFWHHWPDNRLHYHDDPGKGLHTLAGEIREHLTSEDFWSLAKRLATGRQLVITADHGYANSGQFPDADKEQSEYLKKRYKSGRWSNAEEDSFNWVPPLDLVIESDHGSHRYVNGRRKWKSGGGYPTLTHGGLSLLEVAVPFVVIEAREKGN